MDIFYIEALTDKRYEQFVQLHPRASFFHTSLWAQVLHDSYGFRPLYISLITNNNIIGVLPIFERQGLTRNLSGVSLPFSDICEPLLDSPGDFFRVFNACVDVARKKRWRFIELRGGQHLLAEEVVFKKLFTHEIDLTISEEAIFKKFRNSTRRNITHAQKEGVTVTHDNSYDALCTFYHLNCLTRREHGIPPQPWKFFVNLWDTALKSNHGFITIASVKGKAIATDFYLLHGDKAIYKYGASDRSFQQYRANNLAMWEGIKRCKSLNCSTLNLGRTEPYHEGLLQFKRGFGCSETMVNYYRYDVSKGCFISGKSGKHNAAMAQLISKLPIPVLKLAGTILYKYMK